MDSFNIGSSIAAYFVKLRNTTIYEIGYAMACNKMIVLMDFGKTDFDMNFPRNYGLL